MSKHLGYENGDNDEKETGNRRNGVSKKTLRSDQGSLEIEVPEDREGSLAP
jgi:putative transposase